VRKSNQGLVGHEKKEKKGKRAEGDFWYTTRERELSEQGMEGIPLRRGQFHQSGSDNESRALRNEGRRRTTARKIIVLEKQFDLSQQDTVISFDGTLPKGTKSKLLENIILTREAQPGLEFLL